jgi:hypothetical protein
MVDLYKSVFKDLKAHDMKTKKPSHHTSAGRRAQRRRQEFVNMVLSIPEINSMPNTHLFKYSPDGMYELYLKYKYKPSFKTKDKKWTLDQHKNVLPLNYRFSKGGAKDKPPVDEFLNEALERNPYFRKHKIIHKTADGYQNSMLEADNKWWQVYFNQTITERPTPKINYKNLRKAKEILEAQLSNYEFKPMTYDEVRKSPGFKKIDKHSTGFTAPGFSDKSAAAKDPAFRSFVRQFMSTATEGTYSLFFKNESIRREKVQSRGPRVIVASTLENEFMQRCTLQHFIDTVMAKRHDNIIKIGLKNTEFDLLHSYHTNDNQTHFYCADFSAQDKYMPRQFMTSGVDVMSRLARKQIGPHFAQYVYRAIQQGIDKKVVYPNGQLVQYDSLFPTGAFDTANGNSRNHNLLWNYTLLQLGYTSNEIMHIRRSQYGDDVLISDHGRLKNSKSRIIQVSKDLGMPMTFDAWGENPFNKDGSSNPRVTFLKRSFARHGNKIIPKYDSSRVVQKYLTPTHNYGKLSRNVEESIDRQFSFALLAGGNRGLYQNILQNINYLCSKYGVHRSYQTLSYNDMISQFYTGIKPKNDDLSPYQPWTWESDDVASSSRPSKDTHHDYFFPNDGPQKPSTRKSTPPPPLDFVARSGDCWLRGIVSFERKPVVQKVISRLVEDGYDLDRVREFGISPVDYIDKIYPLLEKPVHFHTKETFTPFYHSFRSMKDFRSAAPTEYGHHIYPDHATWVTPDGHFHVNGSTEAHQLEEVYPNLTDSIRGIFDAVNAAFRKREQEKADALALEIERLISEHNNPAKVSPRRLLRNRKSSMRQRRNRALIRMKGFIESFETLNDMFLGSKHESAFKTSVLHPVMHKNDRRLIIANTSEDVRIHQNEYAVHFRSIGSEETQTLHTFQPESDRPLTIQKNLRWTSIYIDSVVDLKPNTLLAPEDLTTYNGWSEDAITWFKESADQRGSQIKTTLESIGSNDYMLKPFLYEYYEEQDLMEPGVNLYSESDLRERGLAADYYGNLKKIVHNKTTLLHCHVCGDHLTVPFDFTFTGSLFSDSMLCDAKPHIFHFRKGKPIAQAYSKGIFSSQRNADTYQLKFKYCPLHGLPVIRLSIGDPSSLGHYEKIHGCTSKPITFPFEFENEDEYESDTWNTLPFHLNQIVTFPSGREIREFRHGSVNSQLKATLKAFYCETPRDSNTHFAIDGTSYTPSIVGTIHSPTPQSRVRKYTGRPNSTKGMFGRTSSRTTRMHRRLNRRQPCLKCKKITCRCTIEEISLNPDVHYRMQYVPGFLSKLHSKLD